MESYAPTPQTVIPSFEWSLEPSILVGLALFTAAYLLVVGPLRRKYRWGPQVPGNRQVLFYLGVILAFLALCSPLDELGDEYLFSAHMVQHVILTVAAPALWLLGLPEWFYPALIPQGRARRWLDGMTHPVAAFLILNGVIWGWHIPAAYDAALENEGIHILEHLMFMGAGLISWSPVLLASRRDQFLKPVLVFYLFLTSLSCTALAALLVFSQQPLYPFYTAVPRAWGISALFDQQIAGLVMWLPPDMAYILSAIWVFMNWLGQENRLISQ